MRPIVGVTGQAGVGKDTLADYLVREHNFVRIALADPMKRLAKRIYGFSDEQLWGPSHMRNAEDARYPRDPSTITPEYPQKYLSPRMALQVMGTEFGRRCYINTWVDMALRDADKVLRDRWYYTKEAGLFPGVWPSTDYDGVVIPDCRFKNEFGAVWAAGGLMVRLKRDLGVARGSVGVPKHSSEMEQLEVSDSEFDLVVDCVDGVEAFHAQLDAIIPGFLDA